MKIINLAIILLFLLFGCNINPNKEARIQALESELVHTKELINKMEARLQALEDQNKELKTMILKME